MPVAVSNAYTHLRNLLAKRGPESTYHAVTGQYKELGDIETKTAPNVLGHPLATALLRATGLAPLAESYDKLLRRSIIAFRPEFEQYARSALAEPVNEHIFSGKPNFGKYLASIDDKVKDDLAGRYLAALFTSTPEHERAVVGGQAYNETLRDRLVMDLTMRLYPGVADVAAQELAKWYHAKYGPIVSQMTPDEIRASVESYVDMFDIGRSEKAMAVKRILSDPMRVSVAVGTVHGGESIDRLKRFLAKRFGEEQARLTTEKLLASPGDEFFFRTEVEKKRPILKVLYTYPQILSEHPLAHLLAAGKDPDVLGGLRPKPETLAAISREKLYKLELIMGELDATKVLVREKVQNLGSKEWDRIGKVIKHLHNKFGDFPGLSAKPPLPGYAGMYFPTRHDIRIKDDIVVFFHELGHGLSNIPRNDAKLIVADEIAANALSIAVAAYAKGLDDHPLVQSAKRAGLLPGGSDVVKLPIDWAVEDVIPYIFGLGPTHSYIGDYFIERRRKHYGYDGPPIDQSQRRTTPVIDTSLRGF